MKYVFYALLLFLSISPLALEAQVVNRAPYIQRPSQTTATIAWRRANVSTGMLYLGTSSGVWFDSLSTQSTTQKHFFDIAGLQPNVEYFYQAKSIAPNDTFISNIASFYTAPLPLEDGISFLAYGDCGYNNTMQHQVKALMEQEVVDFAIVTGDVDQNVGDNYDNIFFGVYADILKRDCHFTCIGNHDTYADNAATYLDAFYLPSNNPANSERYYSFEWGDSKFICLDANIPYTIGSPQFNWMVEEMRCNDKKWLLVFFHQPPWTNAWSLDYYLPGSPYFWYQGDEDMRSDLVPEFERYGVDFVVNGHSHCYQRGELNGVQYIITGGAGASNLDLNTNSNAPNISVEIYENNYVRFDISGDTAKYVMINENGQLRDLVLVVKSYTHYNASLTTNNASCNAVADGQAQLNVQGPVDRSPYSLLWSTGATNNMINSLSAGNYTLSITDALGCERIDSFNITEPPAITSQISSSSGSFTICDNSPINLTASGSYPNYLWSTSESGSSIQVNNSGTFAVTITDNFGCDQEFSTQVTNINSPSGTSIQYTANALMVNFSSSGGISYVWDFGDGNGSWSQTPQHTYSSAGTYNVQLIVNNSCGSDTTVLTITVNDASSIGNSSNFLNLRIQPNPFQTYCLISFDNPQQEKFQLMLTDLQGRILRVYENIQGNQVRVDKAELASGTYIYRLQGKDKRVLGKLVIE